MQGRSLLPADELVGYPGRLTGDWSDVVPRTAGSTALIDGLEEYDAVEFRVVAHNDDGAGPPSEPTGPLLTDSDNAAALAAPRVIATSSASFAITWGELGGACRPKLRWAVSVLREPSRHASIDDAPWETLAYAVAGVGFQALPLRCPASGCAFRVTPVGLRGLERPSAPSEPAASLPLPALHPEAARLQLRLRRPQVGRDLTQMADLVAAEIAAQLRVDAASVEVRDMFGAGQYLVLDLFAASQSGAADASTAARLLAQQLQVVVEHLPAFALSSSEICSDLDAVAGAQLLLEDGRLTQVFVSEEARAAAERLPKGRWASSPAATFTEVVGIALLVIVFAGTCLRHTLRVVRARANQAEYGQIATPAPPAADRRKVRDRPKRVSAMETDGA